MLETVKKKSKKIYKEIRIFLSCFIVKIKSHIVVIYNK